MMIDGHDDPATHVGIVMKYCSFSYDDIATYVDIATSLDVDISTYDAGSS